MQTPSLDSQSQVFLYNSSILVSLVILYYDYFLNLDNEIDRYWDSRSKFTLSWALFAANRYLLLLGYIPFMVLTYRSWTVPNLAEFCDGLDLYHEILILLSLAITGRIVALRIYAIYGRSRRILGVLLAAPGAVTAYALHSIRSQEWSDHSSIDLPTLPGCIAALTPEQVSTFSKVFGGLLSLEVLFFVLTVHRSLGKARRGVDILSIMLRDGTIYFGVMALSTISVLVTARFCPPYMKGMTASLTITLSSTMTSRFMLNLRDPDLNGISDTHDSRRSAVSDLVFEIGRDTTFTLTSLSSSNEISEETVSSEVSQSSATDALQNTI